MTNDPAAYAEPSLFPEPSPKDGPGSLGLASGSADRAMAPKLYRVWALILRGLTSVQMARELGIKPKTAANYRNLLNRKLGLLGRDNLLAEWRRKYRENKTKI